jgi:hypothetical protein
MNPSCLGNGSAVGATHLPGSRSVSSSMGSTPLSGKSVITNLSYRSCTLPRPLAR